MSAARRTRNQTIRCAVYTRVSTPGQLSGAFTSLDSQKSYCESYILSQEGKGWCCLSEVYADPGFSGTTLDRPGLKKLLADVDAGQIDTIVVYRFDRISRSTRDFHNLIGHLDQRNVSFVSVSEQIDTSEPSGQVMRSIMASFAQFERDVISLRTKEKIAASKRAGMWCGGLVPLGFLVHPDGGKLVIDPDTADVVRSIFKLYLKLMSLSAVAEELNRRGWRTKRHETKTGKIWGDKRWTKTTVHHVLTNPLYVGKIRHKSKTYLGLHDATIDQQTWDDVQELLKENCRNNGASTRNKHEFILRGLVYCEACCAVMNPSVTRRGDRAYRYMTCAAANRNGWHTCPRPSVSASKIEAFVTERIAAIGSDPSLQKETVRQVHKAILDCRPELTEERKRLRSQLTKANREIDNLVATLGSGKVAVPSIVDRLHALEGQTETLNHRLAEIDRELGHVDNTTVDEDQLANALTQFSPVWEHLFPLEKTRLIHLLIERIDFDGAAGKIAITYRDTGILTLAQELVGEKGGSA
ncbi:MAG: recombinase family protein [Bacteroidales bacterium]|nr:recombinase family protein [Candidatus Latescibacterota bacterium]